MNKITSGQEGWWLYTEADDDIQAGLRGTESPFAVSSSPAPLYTTFAAAWQRDTVEDTVRAYLDGVGGVAVIDTATTSPENTNPLSIGGRSTNGDLYSFSEIFGVAWARRVLTDAEIVSVAAALLAAPLTGSGVSSTPSAGSIASGAVPLFRSYWARRFVDGGSLSRQTDEGTFHTVTLQMDDDDSDVIWDGTGGCLIRPDSRTTADYGEKEQDVERYSVLVPHTAAGAKPGDDFVVVSSAYDPDLVGATLKVREVVEDSYLTKYEWVCERAK